jgi:hypothetical protein
MPRVAHILPQTSEENWVPLSKVSDDGTPKRVTQPEKRASAQLLAEVDLTGMASAQRVDLSTIVNR